MENKTRFITPILMLFAGALSSIIMVVREYDLYTMLWTLLIVLIVFFVIGDIVRYIYASTRPRIIPTEIVEEIMEQQTASKQKAEAEEEEYEVEAEADESSSAGDGLDFDLDDALGIEPEGEQPQAADQESADWGGDTEEYTEDNLYEI